VVAVCLALGIPLILGLESKDITLLALTFLVCTIGIGSGGRTSLMLGVVQLVIFAAFLVPRRGAVGGAAPAGAR
jgi:Ca2+:H+ antiporter